MYRPNWMETLLFFSDMPIQLAATNRLHHRPPCSLNNEYWLSVYQITTKNNEYLLPWKRQNMRKNMRYAHLAKICEKCGKVPNMRQSHIRVFLTCLVVKLCGSIALRCQWLTAVYCQSSWRSVVKKWTPHGCLSEDTYCVWWISREYKVRNFES